MKYVVVSLVKYTVEKIDFDSSEEAWNWIKENRICDKCKKDLDSGGYWESSENKEKEFIEIIDVSSTSCGAEWGVCTSEDYKKYKEGEISLMEACGWRIVKKPMDNKPF